MQWIDGHLDLAYLVVSGRDLLTAFADAGEGCVSLPALRQGGIRMAFATIFTEPGELASAQSHGYPSSDDVDAAERVGLRQMDVYQRLEEARHIAIVRTVEDLSRNDDRLKCVILMEGADPIRSPEHVPTWFARGLRIVGLTWAAGTRYAGGNGSRPGEGPLTAAGVEMVRALDAAGIVHDVSHLSDRAFDGVMEHAKGRVIASHSNCRALVEDKQRHLRDDQINAISHREGIIGLNLYSAFLAKGRRATIADCVAHVEHVAELMGHRRGVALGSDMDGGFKPNELPVGVDHPTKLKHLAEGLHDAGWSAAEVAGFAHDNWLRFLGEVLPGR